MPSRDPLLYLEDILENIERARSFAEGMSREEFLSDHKSVYAVVRALEIISEASRNVPEDVKERHPEVPWRDVAGAGNVYRHGYPAVETDRVWITVTQGLEDLYAAVSAALQALGERERDEGDVP
jgi:uncharacterized protein with HEPN domain